MTRRAARFERFVRGCRRSVARLIAVEVEGCSGDDVRRRVDALLGGSPFDVWETRRVASRLVSEAEALVDEHVVFGDWCRARGLDPEDAGWPRSSARAWAHRGGARRAPMAASFLRAARRLFDTLDGRCPWAPHARPLAVRCLSCTPVVIESMTLRRLDGGIAVDHVHTTKEALLPGEGTRLYAPGWGLFAGEAVVSGAPGTKVKLSMGGDFARMDLLIAPRQICPVVRDGVVGVFDVEVVSVPCTACGSTGHARSSLPSVEWPAFLRRDARDVLGTPMNPKGIDRRTFRLHMMMACTRPELRTRLADGTLRLSSKTRVGPRVTRAMAPTPGRPILKEGCAVETGMTR